MTDFPTIRPAPTSTAERLSTINSRLSTFRLSTFDYKTHWQSGTEPGKMAENHSKNRRKPPGFSPGVLCRGCGGRGLALPGVSVPPAACPLWAALCALCGGCGRYGTACTRGGSVHLCAAVPGLWLLRSVPLSIVPAWPVEGQRKARASCTSSTRAQKNRRRDCTRGGSVVSFIHFQQFGQDSERNN